MKPERTKPSRLRGTVIGTVMVVAVLAAGVRFFGNPWGLELAPQITGLTGAR